MFSKRKLFSHATKLMKNDNNANVDWTKELLLPMKWISSSCSGYSFLYHTSKENREK